MSTSGSSPSVCTTTHIIAEEAEAWEGPDLARQGCGKGARTRSLSESPSCDSWRGWLVLSQARGLWTVRARKEPWVLATWSSHILFVFHN